MANKKYKILVPKPCAIDEHGMDVQLLKADSIVEAEIKRARNEDGTLKGDDPDTPEVNEAWEGGIAPKKKSTKKKS